MKETKPLVLMKRLYPDGIDGTSVFYSMISSKLTHDSVVLDLGCGSGRRETDLRRFAKRVIGCDLSEDVYQNEFVSLRTRGDAYKLPFGESTFDAVLMDYVIEHLAKPSLCLREVARVLKPHGRIFFRTPNLYHYAPLIAFTTPHRFHRKVLHWLDGGDEGDSFPTYYRANTRRALKKKFEDAGFVTESLLMVEKEPRYLSFSRPTVWLGYGYEKMVNSGEFFARFRSNVFGVMVKSLASL